MVGGPVADFDTVKQHVDTLLREYLGVDELVTNSAGDVPIRSGSAIVYVHLVEDETPLIQLISPILREVKGGADLFAELNRLNSSIEVGRLFWESETVYAVTSLIAETL